MCGACACATRARRDALLQALARSLPMDDRAARLLACSSSSSSRTTANEPALLAAAAARGVGMEGLSWHRFAHGGAPGILLGYGNLSEPAIEQGVRLIAQALAEVQSAS